MNWTLIIDILVKIFIGLMAPATAYMTYTFAKKMKEKDLQMKLRDEVMLAESKKREEERKKLEDEREERFKKFISASIEDVKAKMVNIEMKLESHIEDTDFRFEFQDAVRNKARQNILILNNFLNQSFKNILSNWADSIEAFGLDWYDNIRKMHGDDGVTKSRDKKEIDDFLTHSMNVMISDFDTYIDSVSDEIKLYNGRPVYFSQFITQQSLHNKTELLKLRLVQNGFKNNKDIIKEFKNHIDDFFSLFTQLLTIWNGLEQYEKRSKPS